MAEFFGRRRHWSVRSVGAEDFIWRNVRLVDVRVGGGDGGVVVWHGYRCRQAVQLLHERRRDDGVSRRNHGVGHDAQTHRITVGHERQGQTC